MLRQGRAYANALAARPGGTSILILRVAEDSRKGHALVIHARVAAKGAAALVVGTAHVPGFKTRPAEDMAAVSSCQVFSRQTTNAHGDARYTRSGRGGGTRGHHFGKGRRGKFL